MKAFSLFFLIVCFSAVSSQVMWQVKSDGSSKWFIQEADEFNANELNTNIWKYGYPWGNYVYELDLLYKSENILFTNGTASLIAKKHTVTEPVVNEYIDTESLKKNNKLPNTNGQYTYDYSSGAISSIHKFKYGYFEMRFKANEEQGVWPAFWLYGGDPNDEIDFYEGKGERNNQIHIDVHCPNGCDNYKGGFLNLQKNWGAWLKTNESLGNDWNIISGEWDQEFVKFFLNGEPIGYFKGSFKTAQHLLINSAVAKNGGAFNPGPNESTQWPNAFAIDYVRVWGKEDTAGLYKDNYKVFEHSATTIDNGKLYSTSVKKKVNFVYNKTLTTEQGTITILPILYNKYSVSVAGKKLGKIQIDVTDRLNQKVAGFAIENTEYYILDLSHLPTGPYTVTVKVLNQTLTHHIPIINPAKVGIQK